MSSRNKFDGIQQLFELHRASRKKVHTLINEFIDLQDAYTKDLKKLLTESVYSEFTKATLLHLSEVQQVSKQYEIASGNLQLVLYGPNNCGKTSYIYYLLQTPQFLAVSSNKETVRITKLTYAKPDEAYLHVYNSLNDAIAKNEPKIKKSLSSYFPLSRENSRALREFLAQFITRSKSMEPNSIEFSEWAKCFVQIGMPADILRCGIDLYDTPGFIFKDAPILKENMRELVGQIRPTILFMYENPSIDRETDECFMTLKNTLGDLNTSNIFFLNTHVDTASIFHDNDYMPEEAESVSKDEFLKLFKMEREKRYQSLRQWSTACSDIPGGLGSNVDECKCFGTVTTFRTAHSEIMNRDTLDRLSQFAAKSAITDVERKAKQAIAAIGAFFEFTLISIQHKIKDWDNMKESALNWSEIFFEEFEKQLKKMGDDMLQSILNRFDENIESIAKAAAEQLVSPTSEQMTSAKTIEKYVQMVVQEKVVKPAINDVVQKYTTELSQQINRHMQYNGEKNPLLQVACRETFVYSGNIAFDTTNWLQVFLYGVVIPPLAILGFVTALPALPFVGIAYMAKKAYEKISKRELHISWIDKNRLDRLNPFSISIRDNNKRVQLISDELIKTRLSIANQKESINNHLGWWLAKKKVEFKRKIEAYYQAAKETVKVPDQTDSLAKTYITPFTQIELRLVAIIYSIENDYEIPSLNTDTPVSEDEVFIVHRGQWNSKKNICIKHLKDNSASVSLDYIEAYYHRKVTEYKVPYIAPLHGLLEISSGNNTTLASNANNHNSLWMVLPKYTENLSNYLSRNVNQITQAETAKMALQIAYAIQEVHGNGLVHHNIKAANILLDENNDCYLSDFRTCQYRTSRRIVIKTPYWESEMTRRSKLAPFFSEDFKIDIMQVGMLMYELTQKVSYSCIPNFTVDCIEECMNSLSSNVITSYKELMKLCLNIEPTKRPDIHSIVAKLEMIYAVELVPNCLICKSNVRELRSNTCGHKLICSPCQRELNTKQQDDHCCLCRRTVTKWVSDTRKSFYILQQEDI